MAQTSDQTRVCTDCGAAFVFTEAEQAFFAERSLAPPKRCKPCREARKRAGGARTSFPPPPTGYPEPVRDGAARPASMPPSRPRFEICCAECGALAEVPFKPLPGRIVYCPACHKRRVGSVRQATDGIDLDPADEGIIE